MSGWQALKDMLKDRLLLEEPLARHTSLRLGGPAEALARVENFSELKACLDFAAARKLPLFHLAAGTNLLVRDGGVRGLCLRLEGDFAAVRIEAGVMRAGAAARLRQAVQQAAEAGLAGLEFAAGIPGSVGGALAMNAGAGGFNMSMAAEKIGILDNGRPREIPAAEAGYRYRGSRLLDEGVLILWGIFRLG